MAAFNLTINGKDVRLDADPEMPLLWVLRDLIGLTGTKYSCGEGLCGTCTVLVDGAAQRACITPIASVAGAEITTIEGLSPHGDHPIQRAWLAEKVTQCGYCQPGQIMNAAALLSRSPDPSDQEIDAAMKDVLCRCGSYPRVRRAIHRAAKGG